MSLQVYGINVWLSKATHRYCTPPALLYWLIFKLLLAAPKLQTTNESGGFLCTNAPTCEGATLDKGLDGNMQDLLNLTKSVLDYNRWLQLQMTYMNHACIAQQRLTLQSVPRQRKWGDCITRLPKHLDRMMHVFFCHVELNWRKWLDVHMNIFDNCNFYGNCFPIKSTALGQIEKKRKCWVGTASLA